MRGELAFLIEARLSIFHCINRMKTILRTTLATLIVWNAVSFAAFAQPEDQATRDKSDADQKKKATAESFDRSFRAAWIEEGVPTLD